MYVLIRCWINIPNLSNIENFSWLIGLINFNNYISYLGNTYISYNPIRDRSASGTWPCLRKLWLSTTPKPGDHHVPYPWSLPKFRSSTPTILHPSHNRTCEIMAKLTLIVKSLFTKQRPVVSTSLKNSNQGSGENRSAKNTWSEPGSQMYISTV